MKSERKNPRVTNQNGFLNQPWKDLHRQLSSVLDAYYFSESEKFDVEQSKLKLSKSESKPDMTYSIEKKKRNSI